ncbi:hypothetical protein N2152v2_001886 [Parachlorella kessleri]
MLAGEPVTVVALGGSVTWGAIQGNGYASQFFSWITATFPTRPGKGPHRLLNRGVGGATSSLFATCTRHFVPGDADLVIVEFALNDGAAMTCRGVRDPFDAPPRRAFEVLLRKLLGLPSHPAVVLLMYYNWFMAKAGEGCPAGAPKECLLLSGGPGQFHVSGENDLAVLGAYYGLPVLSMRAALYPLLLSGTKGFNVSTWASNDYKPHQRGGLLPNLEDLVYLDHIHPADATGMRYLADLLVAALRHAARDLAERPLCDEDRAEAAEPLLPPMVLGNEVPAATQCFLQAELGPLGTATRGFQFVNEQTRKSSEKWGWVAREPGAQVVFTLDTRLRRTGSDGGAHGKSGAQSQSHREDGGRDMTDGSGSGSSGSSTGTTEGSEDSMGSGPRQQLDVVEEVEPGWDDGTGASRAKAAQAPAPPGVQVLLGYLKSYEHMGTATVACVSGCSCDPVTIDGHWERQASLPDIASLQATPSARCRISVTVGQETASGEHKVKVVSLMVLDGGLSTRTFTGGQVNALGNQERFSEMQWAFKAATNAKEQQPPAAGSGSSSSRSENGSRDVADSGGSAAAAGTPTETAGLAASLLQQQRAHRAGRP